MHHGNLTLALFTRAKNPIPSVQQDKIFDYWSVKLITQFSQSGHAGSSKPGST
ncbi:hypothetical protein [Xenorhabdus sp. NBAII XenSa04]|uniref:hypothetical protein n=1 Tax=Xenorhabdus sp. NBAII XenSa04 TaxID=1429873 RepID=UPI001E44CC08|nr:hypothetical protein [Xenorhabdus sp. NBAII XenSa04]